MVDGAGGGRCVECATLRRESAELLAEATARVEAPAFDYNCRPLGIGLYYDFNVDKVMYQPSTPSIDGGYEAGSPMEVTSLFGAYKRGTLRKKLRS